MASHRLDPAPTTVTDVFDPDRAPVLTVDPGDCLVVHTLDASGYLSRPSAPGEQAPTLIPDARGHCLAGPIEIRGAAPGDLLAIEVHSLVPDPWGWTVSVIPGKPLTTRLGLDGADPSWLLWDLDGTTGRNQYGHIVDLHPFLGVMGLPPAEPGEHSTIPPRPSGGNIDCRELGAGATLYLPVTVPGAMLCVGDGHGAQGDGEVCGTALECGMTTELRLDLVRDRPLTVLHAETPRARITFGLSPDLNEATAQALEAMITWMAGLYDLDRATALALASPTVDLRVTQIANDVWGVHAVLSRTAIRMGR